MKHIVYILCLMAGLTLSAQEMPILSVGPESKDFAPELLKNCHYIGTHNNLGCWLTEGSRHQLQLRLMDKNTPVKAMNYERGMELNLLSATIGNGRASMLFVDSSERRLTVIYKSVIDLDSMLPADGTKPVEVIDSLTYGRKDRCYVWAASSPNGMYNGLITILEFKENNQYSANIVLFDKEMRMLWSKQFALGTLDKICVTDDGTIVSLGYENEPKTNETHFIFNVVNEKMSENYDVTVKCDPIVDLQLAGVVGRHALATGLFRAPDTDERKFFTGGAIAISFNIDSVTMSGFAIRSFQNEDLNIFYNKKTKKIQRDQMVDHASIIDTKTIDYGALVLIGRNYLKIREEANGANTTLYTRMGLHLMAIDTMGRVQWVRNFRRNDISKKNDALLQVCLQTIGDNAYILKSESRKYPTTYDISKDANEYEAGDKANVVMYSIKKDGEVNKTIIQNKAKFTVVRSFKSNGNVFNMIAVHGNKSQINRLEIR